MSIRSGKYDRSNPDPKQLNVSAPPITVKSKNNMKKTKSKAFRAKATLRRAAVGTKSQYTSAVKKATSGRPGAGRTIKSGTKGVNVSRIQQVSPAQKGAMRVPMASVTANPRVQTKKNVSNGPKSLAMFKKSIKKSMGY